MWSDTFLESSIAIVVGKSGVNFYFLFCFFVSRKISSTFFLFSLVPFSILGLFYRLTVIGMYLWYFFLLVFLTNVFYLLNDCKFKANVLVRIVHWQWLLWAFSCSLLVELSENSLLAWFTLESRLSNQEFFHCIEMKLIQRCLKSIMQLDCCFRFLFRHHHHRRRRRRASFVNRISPCNIEHSDRQLIQNVLFRYVVRFVIILFQLFYFVNHFVIVIVVDGYRQALQYW